MITSNLKEFEQKIELLDYLFQKLNTDELRKKVEEYRVIDKLKGEDINTFGPLMQLVSEHNTMITDMGFLRVELQTFKNDFKSLISLLEKPYDNFNVGNLQTLKNRYQAY